MLRLKPFFQSLAVLNEIEGRLISEGLVESVPRCEGALCMKERGGFERAVP